MAASKPPELGSDEAKPEKPQEPEIEASQRTTQKEQLELAREDVKKLLKEKFCHPIIVRLAWHDSGTYDKVLACTGAVIICPEKSN